VEVAPTLVVDRDRDARAQQAAQLDRIAGRHRVAHGARHREAHAAEVEQRGVDLQAAGDVAHAVVEHGVPRDPQHAVLLAVPADGEPDHVTRQRKAERRSVATRSSATTSPAEAVPPAGGVERRSVRMRQPPTSMGRRRAADVGEPNSRVHVTRS